MGILTVVLVGLGVVFTQAVTAHNIASGQADIHQQVRFVFDYLRRELDGIPRGGRLVVASPAGALNEWGVPVSSDVLTFTTATPLPVRRSSAGSDPLRYNNLAGVCYYRLPDADVPPTQQVLYRVMDRMDTGETFEYLVQNRVAAPRASPAEEDQLALRVITPRAAGSLKDGAFEVEYYDAAAGRFRSVDDPDTYDSLTRGLPRAVRVRLRCWDRGMHVRDEESGERGIEFQEIFAIPSAQ